jgi:hypothetical protein
MSSVFVDITKEEGMRGETLDHKNFLVQHIYTKQAFFPVRLSNCLYGVSLP